MKLFVAACILCSMVAPISGKCERNVSNNVRTYKIDLDSEPANRFAEVTRDFKKEILTLFNAERWI